MKALNDYRSGARKNDMMSLVAPTLKDNVEDLAAYYSAIEGHRHATIQIVSWLESVG